MSQDSLKKVLYRPYTSLISPEFWQKLTAIKLNELKLSQEPVEIHGSYSCGLNKDLPCIASFDGNSLDTQQMLNNVLTSNMVGQLICFNTSTEFSECVNSDHLKKVGEQVWNSICSGEAIQNPEACLSRFSMLVHADIKKYKFMYMFAFPAILSPEKISYSTNIERPKSILDVMTERALNHLQSEIIKPDDIRTFQRGYFIVRYTKDNPSNDVGLTVYNLSRFEQARDECEDQLSELYFAFYDPSGCGENPGWPMRNYLCLIWKQFKLRRINFIRVRMGPVTQQSKIRLQHSLVISVQIDDVMEQSNICPKVSGWEPDELGRLCPKKVDLSKLLNPETLAEDAVNLNLRLMKWRLIPKLDLEKIANTRCLLLGCGTLGCHVARGLLAWGVKNITLVDNSKISYSNPVRQSLYLFEDCSKANDGSFKCDVAAKRLRQIHPTVNVESHVLSIPMPGHTVTEKEVAQVKKEVEQLDKLISDHDIVFLMTDTRESRWLPTVIAVSKSKLIINSAIGFDTFLVQRHPVRNNSDMIDARSATSVNATKLSSEQLGCYFCNDIVAPGNSTWNRTLDQQCTVTRPGVSMLVSALVVELFASIVSSPLGEKSPAYIQIPDDISNIDDVGDLGFIPHSIRGDISRYNVYTPTSPSFDKCSACSIPVVKAYNDLGFQFLLNVFNDSNHLEEVAGLKKLLQDFDPEAALALDSDEDFADE